MVTNVECGIQVDLGGAPQAESDFRTCNSVGVQVGNGDDEMPFCKSKSSECVLTLVEQTSQSTESKEVVIDEGQKTAPEYMCACCCGCLLCERSYPWYSLEGKACPWVFLLTPGYIVLGVIMFPFFVLMTIAYCIAASFE
ncbi:uncharacterized protein LOC141895560 [Acropora palmata]|uniref:uncharacterized protein LOC141895560 n=1 Tax=Acropora palmata TaxID=6131 RepID=UPI003DA01A33